MIELKTFQIKDVKLLSSWINSENLLCQWTGDALEYPLNNEQMEKYIDKIDKQTLYAFTPVLHGTKQPVGHIAIDYINKKHKHGSLIRFIVDPALRKQGYGKKIIKSVLNLCFNELKLHRIELKVFNI